MSAERNTFWLYKQNVPALNPGVNFQDGVSWIFFLAFGCAGSLFISLTTAHAEHHTISCYPCDQ